MDRLLGRERPVERGVLERPQILHVQQHRRPVVALGVAPHDPVRRGVVPAGDVTEVVTERLAVRRARKRQPTGQLQRRRRPLQHERRVGGVHDVEADVEELLEEPRLPRDEQVGERTRLGRAGQRLHVDGAATAAAAAAAVAAAVGRVAAEEADPGRQARRAFGHRHTGLREVQGQRRGAARDAELDVGLELVDVLVVRRADVDARRENLRQGQPPDRHRADDEVLVLEQHDIRRVAHSPGDLLGDRLVAVLEDVEQVAAGVDDELHVAVDGLALDAVVGIDLKQGGDPVDRLVGGGVQHAHPQGTADHGGELAVGQRQGPDRADRRRAEVDGVRRVVAVEVGHGHGVVAKPDLEGERTGVVGDRGRAEGTDGGDSHAHHRVALRVDDPTRQHRVGELEQDTARVLLAGDRDGL